MRTRAGYLGAGLALCMLAMPVWAHTDSAGLTVTNKAEIGTTQLKPGDYKLEVNSSKTMVKVVEQDTGKTVAEVPCQAVQINSKPSTNQVITKDNRVTEIDFRGDSQAVRFGRG